MSAPDMLRQGERYVFDLETNGLLKEVTRIHCAVMIDLDTDEIHEYGPHDLEAFFKRFQEAKTLIGHNIIPFDLAVIEKLHGLHPDPSCEIIDTLNLAKLCYSDIKALDFPKAKVWK